MALSPQLTQLANQAIDIELLNWQQQNHPIASDADVDLFVQYFVQMWNPFLNFTDDIKNIVKTKLNIHTSVIVQQNHVPWFSAFKHSNPMTFWTAYASYITAKHQSTIKLDNETDTIMDCLPKPGNSDFACRGIVIGYVQSGKTSNYIGLINKAIDAGYKLIVIFSGMYNDLRRQTNERIDEGVIGRYTGANPIQAGLWQQGRIINVSSFRTGTSVNNLTSSDIQGDVNGNYANRSPYNPDAITVAVCKKNTHTLDSLLQILDQGQRDSNGYPCIDNVPLLVIDDEADNAGIDTNYDVNQTPQDLTTATAINKKIRCLLTMFKKSAYVGYTATPYANFLIDKQVVSGQTYDLAYTNGTQVSYLVGKGLFPSDFAICLSSNSEYVGPEAIFGDDPLPIVRIYDDQNVNATLNPANGGSIRTLPVDVKEAIHSYIIATAIRRLRGKKEEHSSMLIHVDYRIQNMNDVAILVSDYVDKIKQAYSVNVGGANAYDGLMMQLYQNDFLVTSNQFSPNHLIQYGPSAINFTWQQVQTEISSVLQKLEIKCVNSDDSPSNPFAGNLDYRLYENRPNPHDNGYYVIAVGGNCFSRGLTLEGLTTSFFYRNSTAYDTLMQMGRWFGYRPDYYDLCRIYLSRTIQNRFTAMTVADLHLRELIEKIMAMPNITPENFVMAIEIARGMRPTARNKQGNGTIASPAILEGLKQTTCLPITRNDRQNMFAQVDYLFQNLGNPLPDNAKPQNKNHIWWTHVSSRPIIDFVREFNNILSQAGCLQPNLLGLDTFIDAEVAKGNLTEWTVVLINNTFSRYGQFVMPSASQSPINLTLRTKRNLNVNPDVFSRSKGITQGADESLDFTDAELLSIFSGGTVRDEVCRQNRPNTRGLLLIYPIIISENDQNIRQEYQQYPLFGYAVSSPSGILTRVGNVIFN